MEQGGGRPMRQDRGGVCAGVRRGREPRRAHHALRGPQHAAYATEQRQVDRVAPVIARDVQEGRCGARPFPARAGDVHCKARGGDPRRHDHVPAAGRGPNTPRHRTADVSVAGGRQQEKLNGLTGLGARQYGSAGRQGGAVLSIVAAYLVHAFQV